MLFLRNQRGMTLLEIIIVLVIVVSLIGFLGKGIGDQFKKARRNETILRIAELSKSIEQFYADCGAYPTQLQDLTQAPANCANWGPTPYAKKNTLEDAWKTPLQYSSQGSTYTITSLGAGKAEGGDGINADITNAE